MSLQNISYSFAPPAYFGTVDTSPPPAPPQFYYGEGHHVPKVFGYQPPLSPTVDNDRRKTPSSSPSSPSSPSSYQQHSPQYAPPQTPHYTRVTGGADPRNGKTSVFAIVDYDDDFNDENGFNEDQNSIRQYPLPTVTPIQGPIFLKNGSVPVVPLYSYPKVSNGTLVQIPLMWAALSLAIGYESRGDIIRGTPCIKRNHQLFCPTAGNTYPIERIEKFIDDNKALMRRMYGEFESSGVDYGPEEDRPRRSKRARKYPPEPEPTSYDDSFFSRILNKRQSSSSLPQFPKTLQSDRVDACESKVEVLTPYWANNSAGKTRAIVNTQHFEQAIHQEVCIKSETKRCGKDCRCEQKYKWHRLLAYDPNNDCKGIFMDWFLFPACCVCRCSKN